MSFSKVLRLWGSPAQQLLLLLLPSNCSASKSRNTAISAATAKKSRSNKGVTTISNCSDSCKVNHTDNTLDKVQRSISVLGTPCEMKHRGGKEASAWFCFSAVCV